MPGERHLHCSREEGSLFSDMNGVAGWALPEEPSGAGRSTEGAWQLPESRPHESLREPWADLSVSSWSRPPPDRPLTHGLAQAVEKQTLACFFVWRPLPLPYT